MPITSLNSYEKRKLIQEKLHKWKSELKYYNISVCLYSCFVLFLLVSFSIILFLNNIYFGFLCSIAAVLYFAGILVPKFYMFKLIVNCNINNVNNLNAGIIHKKFYNKKSFSIYQKGSKVPEVCPKIYCTNKQFRKLSINEEVIFFEFLYGRYGIIKKPNDISNEDINLLKNNSYLPTDKNIEDFIQFRKNITLYDNYLILISTIIVLAFGIIIGIKSNSYVNSIIFIIFPLVIIYLSYSYFITPYKPYSVNKFENCYKAMVIDKNIEKRNAVRKYYYGKIYYFISVVDEYGDKYDKIRVTKNTYYNLDKGDSVVCFDYRKPDIKVGNTAAIRNFDKNKRKVE